MSKVWSNIKRAFGRSRTIAVNVVGVISMVFMETSDTLLGINWDTIFKHEVAIGIGLTIQVLNVLLRLDTKGPVSFKADAPIPISEDAPPSPKAE